MDIHASCAARDGHGVLLLGPAGIGKSDLVLRLLALGFELVADDRVVVSGGVARPRPDGAGLLEVRGLGILRMPFRPEAALRLGVCLVVDPADRMPKPQQWQGGPVPLIHLNPRVPSAALQVALALDCVLGRVTALAGALAA
jgi:HPr kinase/phosphorylase